MHEDGLKEDLDDIRVCTSGFICLLRPSPFLGSLAFCMSRRRSSVDASFVEVEVATEDGDIALVETILFFQRVGNCNFFLLDGWTKQ